MSNEKNETPNSNLMVVVYSHAGTTYSFYDVINIRYHNKKLSFDYKGFAGYTHASFNDVAGITKHKGIKNPNIKENVDKEHYNKLPKVVTDVKKS